MSVREIQLSFIVSTASLVLKENLTFTGEDSPMLNFLFSVTGTFAEILKECLTIFTSLLTWANLATTAIIMTAIATFWIGWATFLSVREIKKGREQAITPHIIIEEPKDKYHFHWIPSESLVPIIAPLLTINGQTQPLSDSPITFQLINIGQGSATNIKIQWQIDGKTSHDIIETSTVLKNYKLTLKDNFLSIFQKDINSVGYLMFFSDVTSSIVDYCLPSSTNSSIKLLAIPPDIEHSYILRLIALPRPNKLGVPRIKLANINILVTYSSIDGRKHNQSFVIESWFFLSLMEIPNNSNDSFHFSSDNLIGNITFKVKKTY